MSSSSKRAKPSTGASDSLPDGPPPASSAEVNNPSFDVEAYIVPYIGITKIRRLILIAQRCPDAQLRALQLALDEIKGTLNTELYIETINMAKTLLGDAMGAEYEVDDEYLKRSNRQFSDRLTRLESDLNVRLRESVKSRIRETYYELAGHLMLRGDVNNALAKYLEVKDYSENHAHTIEACINAIKASILLGSMGHVKNQADRAQALSGELSRHPEWASQIQASMGLYELKRGNFSTAADYFLNTDFVIDGTFNDIVTSRDVILYATLCGLCAYDRRRLHSRFLDNQLLIKFFELMPELKAIVEAFYNCQFGLCFQMLTAMEKDLLLDLYLSKHVRDMFKKIRERALIQYFKPFTSVQIVHMAEAFAVPVDSLEKELINLIGEKKIQARIDSANGVLVAKNSDERISTFEAGLATGEEFVRDAKASLLRMSLLKHDFVVRSPKEVMLMQEEALLSDVAASGGDDSSHSRGRRRVQ